MCLDHAFRSTISVMSYDPNNPFAKILRDDMPAVRVFEDDRTLAFMDVMPQSDGHTLIIPKERVEDIFDVSPETLDAVIATTQRVALAVRTAFRPAGVQIMQLNGSAAGQTVFHLHFHVIPRYGRNRCGSMPAKWQTWPCSRSMPPRSERHCFSRGSAQIDEPLRGLDA